MKLKMMIFLSLTFLVQSACAQTRALAADRCYLVEGSRSRYLEIDQMARELAKARNLSVEGEDSSALSIETPSGLQKLIVTSPFGGDAAIISSYRNSKKEKSLDGFLDALISKIRTSGFVVEDCDSIPGLRRPLIGIEDPGA